MLEDYDPYLSNFLQDVGALIAYGLQTVELLIGIGYFVGCKSVQALQWIYTLIAHLYDALTVTATIIWDETTEFGGSFLRAILLIFYGIQAVIDAFYVTTVDLINLCVHFAGSLSRTVSHTWSFFGQSLHGVFYGVPTQVVEALSIVGESTVSCFYSAKDLILDFLMQMIISPIRVVLLIAKTLVSCILLPLEFLRQMPSSSILGLIVIIICAFACRRMLRYLILGNILRFFGLLLSLLSSVLSFMRVNRLKSLISSTVFTVTKMHSHDDSSGYKIACVICQDKPVSYMANECRHVCLCEICVQNLVNHDSRCPICRRRVSQYDRVFIP